METIQETITQKNKILQDKIRNSNNNNNNKIKKKDKNKKRPRNDSDEYENEPNKKKSNKPVVLDIEPTDLKDFDYQQNIDKIENLIQEIERPENMYINAAVLLSRGYNFSAKLYKKSFKAPDYTKVKIDILRKKLKENAHELSDLIQEAFPSLCENSIIKTIGGPKVALLALSAQIFADPSLYEKEKLHYSDYINNPNITILETPKPPPKPREKFIMQKPIQINLPTRKQQEIINKPNTNHTIGTNAIFEDFR